MESEETRLVVDAISAVLVLLHRGRNEEEEQALREAIRVANEQDSTLLLFFFRTSTGPSRLHMQESTAEGCDSEGAGPDSIP